MYELSDLQSSAQGQAGAGGHPNAKAGEGPGGSTHGGGGGHAAGTNGDGGSARGGAPGAGGASGSGGNSAPNPAEGGAESGASFGGASAGEAGAGGAGGADGGIGGTPAISGLVASYPCESANGAVLADASGHGKNATLANGSGGALMGFSFSAGTVDNALTLSSTKQAYVSLPPGVVSQLSEVTIATWVKLTSGAAFQRVFDFGVDTSTFMYLVNAGSNGFVRFRIQSAPLNKNQVLEGAAALPVGKWTHVAVTLGDAGVSIYVDGAQVAQQAPAALRPSDLGSTVNNFIGHSPFAADPYLDGQVDEFRIYERVLSATEIGALANGN
ncbi:MAG TPA: LamG domain-containing protein [Polyangiaceae bacterium]|nr:LamG domain-containing protein [Polyangiaceae bacterium]